MTSSTCGSIFRLLLTSGVSIAWLSSIQASEGVDCVQQVDGRYPRLRSCLRAIPNVDRPPVFPEDGFRFDDARTVWNKRRDRRPTAVFFAPNTEAVEAAVKCATSNGFRVTPASGRQSFSGSAVQDDYVMIDVFNIAQMSLSADRRSVTVGPGVSQGVLQSFLRDSNIRGGVPGGHCTWVGTGGWTLGGGVGTLGRFLGLGCDNMLSLEVVLANGTAVYVDQRSEPDLFFASCGGGGGTFGIATSFTFKISDLPNEGRPTIMKIKWARGVQTTVRAFLRFQRILPSLDRRFGLDNIYIGSGYSGAQLKLQGVFLGTPAEALSLLQSYGDLLTDLDQDFKQTPSTSDVSAAYPFGLEMQQKDSIYDFYFFDAPEWSRNIYLYPTPWYLNTLMPIEENNYGFWYRPQENDYLGKMLRGIAPPGSVVGGSKYNLGFFYSQSRMLKGFSTEQITAIATIYDNMYKQCQAGAGIVSSCFTNMQGHVLGGAYSDRKPTDTAYFWRDRLFVLHADVILGTLFAPLFQGDIPRLIAQVESVKSIMDSEAVYDIQANYVNYQPPNDTYAGWQTSYFGDNYPRLQRIKANYDPNNVFGKPGTVELP